MQFKYRAVTEEFRIKEGLVEASDLNAARRLLLENRWQIIAVQEKPEVERWLGRRFESKINTESLAAFCNQLSMLIRSGVSIVRSLEILESQMTDRRLQRVMRTLYNGVSRGGSLAQAMRDAEGALPELLISLVSVGEESGNLDAVLMSMSAYYERETFVRKKVVSAAIYPMVLTVVLIGLVTLFINFILPEMSSLMRDSHQSLPLLTQLLLAGTSFLTHNAFLLAAGLAALALGLHQALRIPRYRYGRDQLLLRIPLFGKTFKDTITARFARTLALFLHSSIPIVPIFNAMEGVIGNEVGLTALKRARERVMRGETLFAAFAEEKFFDPLMIQMIMVGEETGRLEELMEEVANHYDKRVEVGVGRLIALVEPAFTLLIGLFAGTLIISIALPIFSMASGVK
ncbi:Bacterial general secretion pathway protein F signature [Acididesulfobacillus acetoxydans]|uniref:Bacterial general secretion pathway protein F signature n=1 Tax=Acididesulfobacillus acetoxydans TaxID=1561005 RepID=A0A8S0WP01_9FIRM|nr:type II secretion system F family protein [Acididesulfobacillus acetoxydans]CAA7601564.1 Bacterial general secretion pathway protein F signature [Acididesulfobacillus acetoxydans]CEJ07051.1 Type II secretory pathway, component PulF [Acididesulfobacillus acetoxydans]